MKCPYCDKEIPGVKCPECNETVPEESRYCLYCGKELKDYSATEDSPGRAGEADDSDLDDRIPCSDGACIGIIIDGKCSECGKRYSGKKK